MNPSYAAALALVGWYLMLPPWSGPGKFNDKAPILEWQQAGAFDSASECERDRNDTATVLFNNKKKKLDASTAYYNGSLYASGRCISTDDPRLAK